MNNMKRNRLQTMLMMLFLLTKVLSNQCPPGTTENLLKTITFHAFNSRYCSITDIEYDTPTGDYFYLGRCNGRFISRMDYAGNLIWGRSYSGEQFDRNTLQNSPTYQTLYSALYTNPHTLVKFNSSNGDYLNSYQLTGSNNNNWFGQCSLSKDELALFCSLLGNSSNREQIIVRFDTITSQIDKIIIDASYSSYGVSILAMSSTEVFFSRNSYSLNRHDIVKANYVQSGGSSYSLNEVYHQIINKRSIYRAVSIFGDNDETIWHAANMNGSIVYFQYNSTDFSLIGNKYISSQNNLYDGLQMEAAEGIVCILSDVYYGLFLLKVNATTQDPIQAYDLVTTTYPYHILLRNRYINVLGCNDMSGPFCYHNQISVNFEFGIHPGLNINSSHTFSVTNDYDLIDETPVNHSMDSDPNPSSHALDDGGSFITQVWSNESYVLSLPDSHGYNFTVRHEQVLSFDLPCKVDNFSNFLSCEVGEDPLPSWVSLDCPNSQIHIQQPNQRSNVSESFSIKSTFYGGEVISNFHITCVPCDDTNCESCANETCDTCSINYEIHPTLSLPPTGPDYCPSGYRWSDQISSCEPDYYEESFPEFEWNNDTLSSTFNQDHNNSRYGPLYNSTQQTTAAQALGGIGIFLGMGIALLCGASAQNTWAIIHFLQLVLILPLVVISIDKKVREFILSNAFAALSIYILPSKAINSIPLIKKVSFDQPDEYLSNLGWSSGSTLVNNFMLLMMILVLGIIHLILYVMKDKKSRCSPMILILYKFFTLTIYIRIALEVYMLTVLMLTSEIKHYIKNEGDENFGHHQAGEAKHIKGNYVSTTFSCLLSMLSLMFLICTFVSWENKRNMKIVDTCNTRELYNGIVKVTSTVSMRIKFARLYSLFFLARRLITILIVVLIPSMNLSSKFKISLLIILQIVCMAYAILVRSFAKKIDQITEISNEVVFFILMIFLIKFDSESKWTNIATNIFISIILLQLCVLIILAIIRIIFLFTRYARRQRKNNFEKFQGKNVHRKDTKDAEDFNQNKNKAKLNKSVVYQACNSVELGANGFQSSSTYSKREDINTDIHAIT